MTFANTRGVGNSQHNGKKSFSKNNISQLTIMLRSTRFFIDRIQQPAPEYLGCPTDRQMDFLVNSFFTAFKSSFKMLNVTRVFLSRARRIIYSGGSEILKSQMGKKKKKLIQKFRFGGQTTMSTLHFVIKCFFSCNLIISKSSPHH